MPHAQHHAQDHARYHADDELERLFPGCTLTHVLTLVGHDLLGVAVEHQLVRVNGTPAPGTAPAAACPARGAS